MAVLNQGSVTRYQLQPGESLTIITDAASSCRYGQLPSAPTTPDVPSGNMIAVPASSTLTIGQTGASRWVIDLVTGPGVNVVQNSAQSVADFAAPPDVIRLFGAGAPAATLGANQAQTGSEYIDTSAGKIYVNSGSKSSPSWRIVTSA
jgi:hypothetical protein